MVFFLWDKDRVELAMETRKKQKIEPLMFNWCMNESRERDWMKYEL